MTGLGRGFIGGAGARWRRIGRHALAVGAGLALAAGCRAPLGADGSAVAPPAALPPTATRAGAVTVPAAPARPPRAVTASRVEAAEPPAPAERTVDLAVALRLAGVDNPTINLAREAVGQALAEQLAARALLLPSVNVGANYRRHRGALLSAPGQPLDVAFQSVYAGAGAGVIGGGVAAAPGVRLFSHLGDAAYEPLAARQRVTARRADAHAVRNDTLLQVSVAYLELVGAEARLEARRAGEADLTELARLTAAYAKAGQGRQADASRAAATLDLLRREVFEDEERVAVASARLCRLLSLDPSVRLRSPGGAVEPVRLVSEEAGADELIAAALQARPEVAARAAEVAEAQARVKQERVRPWLPTVSVGFSAGGFGGGRTADGFGRVRDRSEFDAAAVWTVQNLGVGNRARTRAAGAGLGASLAAYDAAVNRIRREVSDAHADARAAATQIGTAEQALAAAAEGFRLERERIRQGPVRPLEALDSFRQLLESRLEVVRATVEFNAAQFRLFVAVGNTPTGP